MKTVATNHRLSEVGWSPGPLRVLADLLLVITILGLITLPGCGGGGSASGDPPPSSQLSGNWQFTMQAPPDGSYVGGLQGGFLLQANNGSVSGSTIFSVAIPQSPPVSPIVCSSGSAAISGSLSGQTVTITAVAGSQTFSLSGSLDTSDTTLTGTYSSTAGTAVDGTPCGTVQSGLSWSAVLVPPIMGSLQGNFHSTQGGTAFPDQDFAVSGTFTQGPNTGASSATVTGTLLFQDPQTLANDYPCITQASVTGQISGNSVILQVFGTNGLDVGQIGSIVTSAPVTFDSTQGGYILHNTGTGPGYAIINTKSCPGVSLQNPGDSGNLCLAFGTSTACTQPLTLSPFSIAFPAQLLGSTTSAQTITLTNTDPSGSALTGLSLSFRESDSGLFYFNGGDFNGISSFVEQDSCSSPFGSQFSLAANQSCTVAISYSPQESCPWIPFGSIPNGSAPAKCPTSLSAILTVNNVPYSADHDNHFSVPIKGSAQSAIVPSPPELDFGAEAVGESSETQTITFTNQSLNPVQILSAANSPCTYLPSNQPAKLPRPLTNDGAVGGIQVARTDSQGATIFADQADNTVEFSCDADSQSGLPNFPVSLNTCLGRLLGPQQSCTLEVTFVPQPGTNLSGVSNDSGLDYFLELNTLQCTSPASTDCEIDSGRFPVEIKANPPSPLRMSPGAGFNFPVQAKGTSSLPLTLTLYNDPNDPNSGTVNFSGKVVTGDYTETDTCPFSLAPGATCNLSIIFTPLVTGADPGNIVLNYNGNQIQTVYLRGTGK